jgi:hypothetical protein
VYVDLSVVERQPRVIRVPVYMGMCVLYAHVCMSQPVPDTFFFFFFLLVGGGWY